jgi:transposase
MSKVDRNAPKRSKASESQFTFMDFERAYPDDATCLERLVQQFYPNGIYCPKCEKVTKHHRVRSRPCYECQYCGHQEYPLVGTIFEGSATSLKLWFHAMFLMTSTRCGISAKQLERELGVTYKCAWRMFNKIRSVMGTDEIFSGTVELDEMYVGGKAKNMHRERREKVITGRGPSGKTPVFGMVQRKTENGHGRVMAKVVRQTDAETLLPHVEKKVLPKSLVYTDEWAAYNKLGEKGYTHSRVAHSQEVYVIGDVHTNTMEGFWSLTKRGIDGVYHSVSDKWLQSYLDEYSFRYNSRDTDGDGIFTALMDRLTKRVFVRESEASSESG